MRPDSKLQQIVPSSVCLSCDTCCRFPEADSFLAPIFTKAEQARLIAQGADSAIFRPMPDGNSARVRLKPHGEIYICPFFAPETSECTIYRDRPLDCQIYPFALMYSADGTEVVLGVDFICPYAETQLETEPFQRYIDHIADYLDSPPIVETIARNWSLIGPYQETVVILRRLKRLNETNAECRVQNAE